MEAELQLLQVPAPSPISILQVFLCKGLGSISDGGPLCHGVLRVFGCSSDVPRS